VFRYSTNCVIAGEGGRVLSATGFRAAPRRHGHLLRDCDWLVDHQASNGLCSTSSLRWAAGPWWSAMTQARHCRRSLGVPKDGQPRYQIAAARALQRSRGLSQTMAWLLRRRLYLVRGVLASADPHILQRLHVRTDWDLRVSQTFRTSSRDRSGTPARHSQACVAELRHGRLVLLLVGPPTSAPASSLVEREDQPGSVSSPLAPAARIRMYQKST